MNKFKKAIAIGTTLATVLWSFGAVLPVSATSIGNGDVVKIAGDSACYYIQGSSKRVFPHAGVYFSWGYPDFSNVKTITPYELSQYSDANPMPFRDGSLFRGTTESLGGKEASAVFYVENATLRPVVSAEVYQALFKDANWSKVIFVPDDLLSKFNYPMGDAITSSATHPDGSLVHYTGATQIYLIQDGKKRAISDDAFIANNYLSKNVVEIPTSETYPDGDPINSVESGLVTPGWLATTSAITVSLAADSPAPTNVPITAQNVPYLKVKIQNGNAATTINSLTIKRMGLGTASDFAKVGLFEGNTQVGLYKTFSSSTDSATFNFSTPLSLEANQTKYYTIKGNLTGSINGHINKIGLVTVATSADVNGLPVYGNSMTATNIAIGEITTFASSSVSDTTPQIGEDGVEFTVFSLTNSSTEKVNFASIKLLQNGTATSDDVSNIGIYQSGDKLGDCSLASNYLTCLLDTPYELDKSQTREFKVKGDIENGYNRTIDLTLEEVYDCNVVGQSYGFGVKVAADTGSESTLTIASGSLVVNFNGPVSADISQGQQDINLANFEITSNDEDAELRTIYFTIYAGASAANGVSADYVENVELYDPDTGGIFDGTVSGNKWKFQPYVTLSKGVKKTYQLRFDTPTDKPATETKYYAYFAASSDITVRGLTSNQNIIDITPSTLTGKTMTAKIPALSFNTISLVAGNIVGDTKGVALYKGIFEAAGENIKVTKIRFSAADTNYFTDANVDHLYLYKVNGSTETLVKEINESQFTGTTATFDGLGDNLVITPGSANAVTIMLRADVAHGASGNLGVKIDTTTTTDIAAEDADGDAPSGGITGTYEDVTGRTLALHANGTLTTADMNVDVAGINKDRYVLAGTTTDWLGRIKFDANYEDIKITKIILHNTTSTAGDSVNKLELYKADKTTKIAEAYWNEGSSDITFDNLNYVVDKDGIDYIYIKAVLNKIGLGAEDTADSNDEIALTVKASTGIEAEGVDTGTALVSGDTLTIGTTSSKSSIIVAARPSSLTNALDNGALATGYQTIAKFTITADSTNNQDAGGEIADLLLKQLKVTFSANADTSVANAKISRVGGVDGEVAIAATSIANGTTATIDVDSKLTHDYKIASGESATFVLKGTVSYGSSGTQWLQSKITGLNTSGTAAIIWNDEYNDFNDYRLDDADVIGGYLSVNL